MLTVSCLNYKRQVGGAGERQEKVRRENISHTAQRHLQLLLATCVLVWLHALTSSLCGLLSRPRLPPVCNLSRFTLCSIPIRNRFESQCPGSPGERASPLPLGSIWGERKPSAQSAARVRNDSIPPTQTAGRGRRAGFVLRSSSSSSSHPAALQAGCCVTSPFHNPTAAVI